MPAYLRKLVEGVLSDPPDFAALAKLNRMLSAPTDNIEGYALRVRRGGPPTGGFRV